MYGLLLVLFVIVCVFLILVVLMQSGRGGGLSGAFGGGGNQTVFGGRGAVDFLGKATWILGGAFMALALVLAVLSATGEGGTKSLIEKQAGSFPTTPLTSPAPAGEGAGGEGMIPAAPSSNGASEAPAPENPGSETPAGQ